MKWLTSFFIVFNSISLSAQSTTTSVPASDVMIVGVAHDSSVMAGGISSSNYLPDGKASVEPIAWLTPDGQWKKLPCDDAGPKGYSTACKKLARDYFSKPHRYSVVSADGFGATVSVNNMSLDNECYGVYGKGDFSGAKINYAAVAAESTDSFVAGSKASRLPEHDAAPIRKAFAAAVGKKLDTAKELRVYSITLEGQSFIVVQRAFQQYADKPEYRPNGPPNMDFVFAVGRMEHERFHPLHWKNNGDEKEQILGLIHFKNGKDYLVNAKSDPETDTFRIYGIENAKFTMVFQGGGGGC